MFTTNHEKSFRYVTTNHTRTYTKKKKRIRIDEDLEEIVSESSSSSSFEEDESEEIAAMQLPLEKKEGSPLTATTTFATTIIPESEQQKRLYTNLNDGDWSYKRKHDIVVADDDDKNNVSHLVTAHVPANAGAAALSTTSNATPTSKQQYINQTQQTKRMVTNGDTISSNNNNNKNRCTQTNTTIAMAPTGTTTVPQLPFNAAAAGVAPHRVVPNASLVVSAAVKKTKPRPPPPPFIKRSVHIVGQAGPYHICKIRVTTVAVADPARPQSQQQPQQQQLDLTSGPQPSTTTTTSTSTTILPHAKRPMSYRQRYGGFHMGMELRICDWMTKETRNAFRGTDPCIAVVAVNRGLAKKAGFRPKDYLCWPMEQKAIFPTTTTIPTTTTAATEATDSTVAPQRDSNVGSSSSRTVWTLMNERQLKDALNWLQLKGHITFFVARKLSPIDLEIVMANEHKRRRYAASRTTTTARTLSATTTTQRPTHYSTGANTSSNNANPVSDTVESSNGCLMPLAYSNEAVKSTNGNVVPMASISTKYVTKDQIRPDKDVVLGRPGNTHSVGHSTTVYFITLTDWWERYELATHTGKIEVCKMVISDMLARGCRFLNRVDDGSRNGYYEVVPSTSESIRKKVLRALRQVVLARTEHLSPEDRAERNRIIENRRIEVRSGEFNRLSDYVVKVSTKLSSKPSVSPPVAKTTAQSESAANTIAQSASSATVQSAPNTAAQSMASTAAQSTANTTSQSPADTTVEANVKMNSEEPAVQTALATKDDSHVLTSTAISAQNVSETQPVVLNKKING